MNDMKFVLEYSLSHQHRVQFGVTAGSADEAIEKGRKAFDDGLIKPGSAAYPLLLNEWTEEDARSPFELTVAQAPAEAFPGPDASVLAITRDEQLLAACRQLVTAYAKGVGSGSVDWSDVDAAHELALMALGFATDTQIQAKLAEVSGIEAGSWDHVGAEVVGAKCEHSYEHHSGYGAHVVDNAGTLAVKVWAYDEAEANE